MRSGGTGKMYRDFSENSKQKLLNLVSEVENEKWSDFTDWIGDRWYDFEAWIGKLSIKNYLNNVNAYHKKVIDKNNTTKEEIINIFNNVKSIDNTYGGVFENVEKSLTTWYDYIGQLSEIVVPSNGRFNAGSMANCLNPILKDAEQKSVDCLRNRMLRDVDGELIFDEELIYEYVKKNPAEMTDAEKAVLLEVISQMKDAIVFYGALSSVGTDELGADILNYVSWMSDSTKYESFAAVSAHYNEMYVNLLNYMSEQSENANTFAASLVNVGVGESVVSILGVETYDNIRDIFGTNSIKAYVAKHVSKYGTEYFEKLEANEKSSLKASKKFDNTNEWLKDKLKDNKLRKEADDTVYMDENGKIISKEEAPNFYKRKYTIAELKGQLQGTYSMYNGNFDLGDWGQLDVTLGSAEAHASISAGLYRIEADGRKTFSPAVDAEIGASVTALEIDWENQLMGDENLGLNADASITVGEASANASAKAQIFGEDGKLNVQAGLEAKAEAIAAEVEGSVGVNVLGGEVGVKGSVNVGVGAHANVGYRDGVFKIDVGASLGVGASISLDVDVGGMVDTVCDAAQAAWSGITDGWNAFTSWWK